MAGDWQEVTVVDVASAGRNALVGGPFGSDLVSRDYVDHGVPVIRGQNMGDRWVGGDFVFVTPAKAASLAANIARAGDIVFTQRGTLGQVSLVPDAPFDRYLVSQSQMKLTVNRELADPLFFYYVFRDIEQQDYIRRNAIQTGVPHTNLGILRATPVPLPPIAEQRAIARILGTLDDKIELNRRLNETLEAIARALFKSWFVDFDPVRAKSEGRDPSLPPHLANLFPDSFEGSELGEIPKGWSVDSAYRIAHVLYGAPFKSKLFNDRRVGQPLIRIRDLRTHDPEVFTSEEHPRGYVVQPGDLVVGMDGEFRAHLWRGPEAWLNQRLCCFKPAAAIPRAFVHYSIESLLDLFERSKTGTTVIHLGKADIDTFRVLVPPDPVLRAFASIVDPIDLRMVAAAQERRILTSLREHLLPRLISGDIAIRGVEDLTEATA
jgi:type I restriction enzyme, S subunit